MNTGETLHYSRGHGRGASPPAGSRSPFNAGYRVGRLFLAVVLALAVVTGSAQPVTLNLKDADIQSLIQTVSAITGRNFIVDPRVKGKVTVVASDPMSEEEVYEVFLSVLRVHGFAAVPGEFFRQLHQFAVGTLFKGGHTIHQ